MLTLPEAEEPEKSEPAEIPVKKGAYNLDFLDNMDDPNFDPFATKTKVVDNFDTDKPPTTIVESGSFTETKVPKPVTEEANDELNTTFEPPKRKPPKLGQNRPKPGVKKTKKAPLPKKNPTPEPETAQEEFDLPPPKSGAYNLDFLDNLDDPNFDPFATKTKVVDTFSEPDVKQQTAENISGVPKDLPPSVESEVPKESAINVESEDLNTTFEPPKRAPPKLGQNRRPVVKKTKKKKPEVAPVPTPDETDMPPPAKGGYNLDFLDNLDDPNLDPFATKTKVQNDNEDAPLPATGNL